MKIQTDITVYGPDFLPFYASRSTDLLGEVYRHDSYMVDNHTQWKTLAPRFPDKRFILGRTYYTEAHDLGGALLGRSVNYPYLNVFEFRILQVEPFFSSLTRLDADFSSSLKPLDELRGNVTCPFDSEQNIASQRVFCTKILELEKKEQSELLESVDSLRSRCRYHVFNSIFLALVSHALVIKRMSRNHRRNEVDRLERNTPNILNDTILLQEALLLDCGVHSRDHKVLDMCIITGRKVFDEQ